MDFCSLLGVRDAEVAVAGLGDDAAARRAVDEAELDEVRLVDVLDGVARLADGSGECVEADGAARELLDHRAQHAAVGVVEAGLVDFEHAQGLVGDGVRDDAGALDLSDVAHALQQAVGDARRAAAAARDLERPLVLDGDVEDLGGALDDVHEGVGRVVLEARDDAEAVAQRRGEGAGLRRRADQGEGRDVEADGASARPLADDDVEREVLHRGVEHLFDAVREAVDLVDEEHIMLLQIRQESGEVAAPFDGGAGRLAEVDAELVGDDAGERRLAEARRPVEQDVVERLAARERRLDEDGEVRLDLLLADVLAELARAQAVLPVVAVLLVHGDDAVLVVGIESVQNYTPFLHVAEFLQRSLDDGFRRLVLGRLADDGRDLRRRVAERLQRGHGLRGGVVADFFTVLDGQELLLRAAPKGNLVLELEDQALGRFLADAGQLRQDARLLVLDGAAEPFDRDGGEDAERDLRADAGDADKLQK